MNLVDIPGKFPIPWGNAAGAGFIRPIPEASQIGSNPGYASLTDGFPPLTATPTGAGGIPPFVQDTNGILNEITAWDRWMQAGGPVTYDLAFATSIGGYPKGAVLTSNANANKFWVNQVDGNAVDPDGAGTNWHDLFLPVFTNPTFTGNIALNGPVTAGNTVNLGANAIATTQALGDNTTHIATDAFVQASAAAVEAYVGANFATLGYVNGTFAPNASFGFGGNVTDGAHIAGLQLRWGRFITTANPHTENYPTPFGAFALMQVACVESGGVGTFTVTAHGSTDPNAITVNTRLNGVDATGITVHYIVIGY